MQYFYSGQIRRFLAQFIRVMSGYQVNFGRKTDGAIDYRLVPCTYGDPSRQAAQIQRANSANTTITVPQISCYITEMKYARDRMQDPTYIKTVNVIQRAVDPVTGNYLNEPGSKFTVDRLMPVPYDLTVKTDIWCSNTDQKLQLLEQIGTQFNPSMELQNSDTFLDWTSLSYINLDTVTWTSRSIPMGNEDQIDVASMTFTMPIWLSTPAKVKKLGVITNIITDLYDGNGNLRPDLTEQGFQASDFIMNEDLPDSGSQMSDFADPVAEIRVGIGYDVIVLDNIATLTQSKPLATDQGPNGEIEAAASQLVSWNAAIAQTVNFQDGVTRLFLDQGNGFDVVGTVSMMPSNSTQLMFNVEPISIPSNTLAPVDKIINPLAAAPGYGLPAPVLNQRYLILHDIGSNMNAQGALAWRGSGSVDLVAKQYDIIQYNGTSWYVSFSAQGTTLPQYVINLANSQQFKWTGTDWLRAWEGLYKDGYWRLE